MKYICTCLFILGCACSSLSAHDSYAHDGNQGRGQPTLCPCGCGCVAPCACGCTTGKPCTCHRR